MENQNKIKRRRFLSTIASAAAGSSLILTNRKASGEQNTSLHRAMYWTGGTNNRVTCNLCPNHCSINNGDRGFCKVRENRNGVLYTMNYEKISSINNDPIEKKPLFHYRPGTNALSIGTSGCNFTCQFCQNWEISQFPPEQVSSINLPPQQLVNRALALGSQSIAFTYNEPNIFYEYELDTSRIAVNNNIGRVMISNGYINGQPLSELIQVLDAVKIDFKSFQENFYSRICHGHLRPVLDTLQSLSHSNIWFEIVVLLIPTLNDSENELRAMSRWIFQNLGADVPLHFTRFQPTYRLTNLPPTPVSTLETAHNIAVAEGLHFVYIGNVPGHRFENTFCPYSHQIIIRRLGFNIIENRIQNGRCACCNQPIPGVWS